MNPLATHPNASLSLGTGLGLGSAVVAVLQHWFGVKLSTQDGVYIAAGLSTVALAIGRNGISGLWHILMHGSQPKESK